MARHLGPNRQADLVMCADGVGWLSHLRLLFPLLSIVPPPVEADAANIWVCVCLYAYSLLLWVLVRSYVLYIGTHENAAFV